MKKLSILCILAILCAIFSSCADPSDIILGNSAVASTDSTIASIMPADSSKVTTLPDAQTTKNPATTSPEAEPSVPDIDLPEIIYDWDDFEWGLVAHPSVFVIQNYLSDTVDDGPFMVCMVTFTDIDYTQIGEEWCEIPITVTIDRIIQKIPGTSLNEGDSITLQQFEIYWKKSGDAYTVHYHSYYFPIAEQGKRYLAIISDAYYPTDEYPLGISALSVPLPEENEISDEYFEAYYKKLGLCDDLVRFAPEALDEWFYPYLESE